MADFVFSSHALDSLQERNIPEKWLWRAINSPDHTEVGLDDNIHYIKSISEHGDRFLRVVVNPHVTPKRIVTVFFDRRLKRRQL